MIQKIISLGQNEIFEFKGKIYKSLGPYFIKAEDEDGKVVLLDPDVLVRKLD